MRIAVVGAGAVGGYFGAFLARAGHDVRFIARGAHGEAIRAHGLTIRGPLGEFTAHGPVSASTADGGRVDLVLHAVKSYDNATALPLLAPLVGKDTVVLTLQNGVDGPDEAAAVVGREAVLGGAAYIATSIVAPGVIEQTGTYRRIVFGEVFSPSSTVSDRARRIEQEMKAADIEADARADARGPLWEKFVYLAPFAGVTGASRQPIGVVRSNPASRQLLFDAFAEVDRVGRAEGVALPPDLLNRIVAYVDDVPASMRSSLLIDLSKGKRIEVEALQGSVVRRAARVGVAVPIMSTLYAVLRAAVGTQCEGPS
jgi:2-dehydropantoate 2-reductase